MHMSEQMKHVFDTVSVATVLASLAAWLPPIAALASLVWTVIRIWETKTVQVWFRRYEYRKKCQTCGNTVKGGL